MKKDVDFFLLIGIIIMCGGEWARRGDCEA